MKGAILPELLERSETRMSWFHGKNWAAIEAVYRVVPPVGMALVTCGGKGLDAPETLLFLRRNYPACFLDDPLEVSKPIPVWVLVLATQVFAGCLFPNKNDKWCVPSIDALIEVGVFDGNLVKEAGGKVYGIFSDPEFREDSDTEPVQLDEEEFTQVCGNLTYTKGSAEEMPKGLVIIGGRKFWVFEVEELSGNESFCCGKLSAVSEEDVAF